MTHQLATSAAMIKQFFTARKTPAATVRSMQTNQPSILIDSTLLIASRGKTTKSALMQQQLTFKQMVSYFKGDYLNLDT